MFCHHKQLGDWEFTVWKVCIIFEGAVVLMTRTKKGIEDVNWNFISFCRLTPGQDAYPCFYCLQSGVHLGRQLEINLYLFLAVLSVSF